MDISAEGAASYFGSEVPKAVTVKTTVFWNVTTLSLVEVCLRYGGTYYLLLQGRRISQSRTFACYLLVPYLA